FLRLYILSLERTGKFSDPAEGGARESAGVCERRPARHARAAVSSSSFAGGSGSFALRQLLADGDGSKKVLRQGGQLSSSVGPAFWGGPLSAENLCLTADFVPASLCVNVLRL